jgi:predicted Zn-dependent peptidase
MKLSTLLNSIAAATLASALPAIAADKAPALPKDLPPYGATNPVSAPAVRQLKLDNGLEVWLAPLPGFPKVAFSVAVRGGYVLDPGNLPGMSDLLADVVSEGTKTHSARQIAEQFQAAGGDLTATATADSIVLATSVLNDKAIPALNAIGDVMQNAVFPDQEVEIAKNNAASSLQASEAEPDFLARRALFRSLFGSHPYAVTSPTRESIANTSAADLRSEYARRFRPDRTLLVAVGDFDPATLTSAIRQDFGSWKASEAAPLAAMSKPAASVARALVYVPRDNSVQTALYIGALAPNRSDPDYAAARVAIAIYGGMFGSRLITNIREDKGYTYSPFAQLAPLRETGVLVTRADVRNAVTGASYNEISYELNRMATTSPEQQELDSAKRYLNGSLALQLQSREAVARLLATLWISALPPEEIGAQSRKIEGVTLDDVKQVGRKYFPAARMTVVAIGEENVIRNELAPFGFEFKKAD